MHALLLAAGLSTRLGPLSAERPKPLLPECHVSLLRWTCTTWASRSAPSWATAPSWGRG